VIGLLTPHILKGHCWGLRYLRGLFGPFGYERPEVLRRRLELAQRRPRTDRTGVQRIHGRVVKRLIGMLLKPAV
jgi:hypothetical protein